MYMQRNASNSLFQALLTLFFIYLLTRNEGALLVSIQSFVATGFGYLAQALVAVMVWVVETINTVRGWVA